MRKQFFSGCAVLLLAVASAYADEPNAGVTVKIEDVPAAVAKTIHKQVAKGKLESIEKDTDGADVTYEVEIRRGGRARSFMVDNEGVLLEEEVFLGETPMPVREAIKKQASTGTLEGITKEFDDGEVSFEAEITRNNQTRSLTWDREGKLLEMDVFFPELPAPVQTAVRKELNGGKLGDITKVFDDDGETYEIEINPDAKSRTVTINAKGEVQSKEEDQKLSDAPAAVQAAVKELLKGGTLEGISKETDGDDVSYDIEIKRGESEDFISLGADGKVIE